MNINPGPVDPSILTDQENHRSEAVWNGTERKPRYIDHRGQYHWDIENEDVLVRVKLWACERIPAIRPDFDDPLFEFEFGHDYTLGARWGATLSYTRRLRTSNVRIYRKEFDRLDDTGGIQEQLDEDLNELWRHYDRVRNVVHIEEDDDTANHDEPPPEPSSRRRKRSISMPSRQAKFRAAAESAESSEEMEQSADSPSTSDESST
ncbi:hypothetical protein J5N97_003911 [Dioscorea zingiberensis]|uniref:Uncharacterized protein n=1 Tax=Dioscorea zingiberensis TaxID=325984 RepID=A0A9D5D7K7_9LILI|nr:hypothetical protein J5N97_003911 [Dioscorea zingiberensis]